MGPYLQTPDCAIFVKANGGVTRAAWGLGLPTLDSLWIGGPFPDHALIPWSEEQICSDAAKQLTLLLTHSLKAQVMDGQRALLIRMRRCMVTPRWERSGQAQHLDIFCNLQGLKEVLPHPYLHPTPIPSPYDCGILVTAFLKSWKWLTGLHSRGCKPLRIPKAPGWKAKSCSQWKPKLEEISPRLMGILKHKIPSKEFS